jgi:hypothetical protein
MLNTVKNVMHRFDGAGAIAKDLGGSSVDLAKTVMHRFDGAGDLAKTVGVGSLAIAKKIGVKRGLAGFAIAGAAAIGGILLARYLKRRASETPLHTEAEVDQEMASETPPVRRRRQSRAKRKANHAHS